MRATRSLPPERFPLSSYPSSLAVFVVALLCVLIASPSIVIITPVHAGCCAWFCFGDNPCSSCVGGSCDGCGCACPKDYTLLSGTCRCNTKETCKCPPTFVGSNGQCVCPSYSTKVNNVCQCVPDRVMVDEVCVCPGDLTPLANGTCACRIGYEKVGTRCYANSNATLCNFRASGVYLIEDALDDNSNLTNTTTAPAPSSSADRWGCICLPGYNGSRCEACTSTYSGYPNCRRKCVGSDTDCNVHHVAQYRNLVPECKTRNDTCQCLANFTGKDCNECAPFYVDTTSNYSVAQRPPGGKICERVCNISYDCDETTREVLGPYDGNCSCKCYVGFEGTRCDTCVKGHVRISTYDPYMKVNKSQCVLRNCSIEEDCSSHARHVAGNNPVRGCSCNCSEGYEGLSCNRCATAYEGYPMCTPIKCTTKHITCRNKRFVPSGLLKDGCTCICPPTDKKQHSLDPPCWSPSPSMSDTVFVSASRTNAVTKTVEMTVTAPLIPTNSEAPTSTVTESLTEPRRTLSASSLSLLPTDSATYYENPVTLFGVVSLGESVAALTSSAMVLPLASIASLSASGNMQRSAVQSRVSAYCRTLMYEDFIDTRGLYRKLDLASSPTQLGVGVPFLYYYRGAVIGNLLLLVGISILVLVLALCWARRVQQATTPKRRRKRLLILWRATLHQWRVPTVLYIPATFFFPSMISLCVTLLLSLFQSSSSTVAVDAAIALLGLLLAIGFVALVTHHTTVGRHAQLRSDTAVPAVASSWGMRLFAPRGTLRWISLDSNFVALYGGLFENMKIPWFCVLDLVLGLVAGILGGVLPMANYYSLSCPAIFAIQLVFNVAYFQCIFMMRPHMVLVEAVLAWINAILGVVWGIAEVVASSSDTPSNVGTILSSIQLWVGAVGIVSPITAFALDAQYREFVINRWKNAVKLLPMSRFAAIPESPPPQSEKGATGNEKVDIQEHSLNDGSKQQCVTSVIDVASLFRNKEETGGGPSSCPLPDPENELLRLPEPVVWPTEEKPPQELVKDFEVLQQLRGGRPMPRATLSVLVLSATLKRLSQLESAVRRGELQAGSRGALDELLQCIRDVQTCKPTTSSSSLI